MQVDQLVAMGFSAEHAARAGFETWVVADACRSIGDPAPMRARLTGQGVRFTTVDALRRSSAPARESAAP